MWKKSRIILLNTKNPAQIYPSLEDRTKLSFYNTYQTSCSNCGGKHIYVLSHKKVEVGDTQINHLTNKISIRSNNDLLEVSIENCSKIIASNDLDLLEDKTYNVLPIPKHFIEVFIKKHNLKKSPIDTVVVKYDLNDELAFDKEGIKIKLLKNTFTLSEVEKLFEKYSSDSLTIDRFKNPYFINQWKEENLY